MPYKHGAGENKAVVNFEYPCYLCSYIMSKPKVVIDHVRRIHGYEIPTRQVGHRRPPDAEFDYQNDPKGDYDLQHYSCASCWFHCPETGIEELKNHYLITHKPKNVDPSKNEEKGEAPSPPDNEDTEHYVRTAMDTDEPKYEIESEEDVQEQEERSKKPQRRGRAKKEQESLSSVDASDILGKLNELTDLFKSLLK